LYILIHSWMPLKRNIGKGVWQIGGCCYSEHGYCTRTQVTTGWPSVQYVSWLDCYLYDTFTSRLRGDIMRRWLSDLLTVHSALQLQHFNIYRLLPHPYSSDEVTFTMEDVSAICERCRSMEAKRTQLPQRHFVHHKSHMTRPGIEPGPPL
jgi:hypothetical protein